MNDLIVAEDRTLAILAHLSGLAGYLIPLGGVAVPIAMMFVFSQKRDVALIAKQALLLNVAVYVCAVGLGILTLTIILIPVVWIVGLALSLAAVTLPIVGALKASQGDFYRYPVVGNLT